MRVEVNAKFASMPTRTAVHTWAVNSEPGMWDTFHPIRFFCQVKGLLTEIIGHMRHNRAFKPRATRSNAEPSFSVQRSDRGLYGLGRPPGPRLRVKVYGDLNTFRSALVPQSE